MSDELKPGEGARVDDKTKYEYGADLESDKVPVIDPGEGRNVIIRTFDYRMNPKMRHQPVDKQTIFNEHSREIRTFLWGDGLRPLEQYAPRVIIDKKKGTYKIFIVCEGAKGLIFSAKDEVKNLTQELAKGKLEPSQ